MAPADHLLGANAYRPQFVEEEHARLAERTIKQPWAWP
jgi:hypothetical protein